MKPTSILFCLGIAFFAALSVRAETLTYDCGVKKACEYFKAACGCDKSVHITLAINHTPELRNLSASLASRPESGGPETIDAYLYTAAVYTSTAGVYMSERNFGSLPAYTVSYTPSADFVVLYLIDETKTRWGVGCNRVSEPR